MLRVPRGGEEKKKGEEEKNDKSDVFDRRKQWLSRGDKDGSRRRSSSQETGE